MITPLFTVGQQVVCVNDEFTVLHAQNPAINVPVQDRVYTVRRNLQFLHDVGLLLQEIANACVPGSKVEPNFRQSRFAAFAPAPAQVLEESFADLF